jgi:hypothetical protein
MGSVVALCLAALPVSIKPSFKTAIFAGLKSCSPRSSPIFAGERGLKTQKQPRSRNLGCLDKLV